MGHGIMEVCYSAQTPWNDAHVRDGGHGTEWCEWIAEVEFRRSALHPYFRLSITDVFPVAILFGMNRKKSQQVATLSEYQSKHVPGLNFSKGSEAGLPAFVCLCYCISVPRSCL